jgi:hypothetical protein
MVLLKNKYWWLVFIASIILPFIFFSSPIAISSPDFDGSFRWVFNYFWYTDITYFNKVIHEVGPFVFLKWPYPIGNHLWMAAFFEFVLRFLLGLHLCLMIYTFHTKVNIWEWVLLYILLLLVTNFESIFYANFLIGCIAFYKHQSVKLFAIPILLFTIGLFLKTTISIPLLSIASILILLLLVQKKIKFFFNIVFIFSICFISIAIPIYKSFFNAFQYIINDVFMVFTYNNDMNIYVINHWLYLPLMIIPLIIVPIVFRQSIIYIAYILASFFLFAMYKYILGRQDFEHYYIGLSIIIIWFSIIFILQNNLQKKILVIALFILSGIGYYRNMGSSIGNHSFGFHYPNISQAYTQLCTPSLYKQQVQYSIDSIHQTQKLPLHFINTIGKNEIDVFPWELSIIRTNHLTPRFRPFLQTAVAGQRGDESDAKNFSGALAPKFVLWHISEPQFTMLNAFDGKYLPNEYPQAFWAMANNYRIIDSFQNKIYLLKKKEIPTPILLLDSFKNVITWDAQKPFIIPNLDTNQIFICKANWKMPFMQKIISSLYKTPQFNIHYQFMDGTLHTFNCSERALHNGILVSKIYLNPTLQYKQVKSISFSCTALNKETPLQISFFKYIVK